MVVGNNKWIIFNFLPYEYKSIERFLENMALKGWKLKSLTGIIFKFKRIEPKRIKYSVDIMDKVSFFDGKNSDRTLEYREYCKEAGWNFVCERQKIQIYCSENYRESMPIHTDEGEKFNCIFKASFKYVVLNLITIVMLTLMQYMATIGSFDGSFLASGLQLFTLIFFIMFAIHETIGTINFIIWTIKGRINLKRDLEVQYNYNKAVKTKRFIYKTMPLPVFLMIVSMPIHGEVLAFKIIILNLLMVAAIAYAMNFISRTKYKNNKKRKLNIISYVVICLITIIIMNRIIFTGLIGDNNWYIKKINKDDYIMTLKDFGEKAISEDRLYVNEEKSFLASSLYYSNLGENIGLSYELFQSKYEWAVKYNFNKQMNSVKKINVKYIKKETDLPDDIKVYMNEHGHIYLMVSSNKIIEISNWDKNLSEDELFNKVYEKVFIDN